MEQLYCNLSTEENVYGVYGITLRLSPNKDDLLYQTFGSLSKLYPTVWVWCDHYDYMKVFDVTNFSDTQGVENMLDIFSNYQETFPNC